MIGIVQLMKNKYNNNNHINEMVNFLVSNLNKAITWTPQEACIAYNLAHANQKTVALDINDWTILFSDDDINNWLQQETIKAKRITIRKIINQLDENKKLSPQEIKAIDTLTTLINNKENDYSNKVQYVQLRSGYRFDNNDSDFDFITETTPMDAVQLNKQLKQ